MVDWFEAGLVVMESDGQRRYNRVRLVRSVRSGRAQKLPFLLGNLTKVWKAL